MTTPGDSRRAAITKNDRLYAVYFDLADMLTAKGQTDEAELGISYEDVDQILHGLEQLRSEAEIASLTGFPLARVREIVQRVHRHRHKRRPAPIPKVGLRTVGIDWRD